MKKLAIIIINWNSFELTVDTLSSLEACTFKDFDIILVDNGSNDGSKQKLEAEFPAIIHLASPENIGFTGGNNLGIRHALEKDYEYVMLLNNDVDVDPGFLEPLMKRMDANPEMGAIQPLIMYHHNRQLVWNAGGQYLQWLGVSKTLSERLTPNDFRQTDWITGCSFMIKAGVLREVGMLEEKYFIYHEDVDLSLRIKKAGYTLWIEPASVIYHIAGMSQKAKAKGKEGFVSPKVHYLNARNRIWTIRKYTRTFEWPTVFIYQFLYMFTVSFYFILRGRFGKLNAWWKGIKQGLSFLISVLLLTNNVMAQTVDLDNLQLEEDIRRAQLMGKIDQDLSFNIRPVQPRTIGAWDSLLPMAGKKPLLGRGKKFLGKHGYIDFTPLQLTTQYAVNSPFKANDGPMIPATGVQSMLSGGFFLKLGPLTFQAKPQLVYAQNTSFKGFPQEHSSSVWQSYLYAMSHADLPERFGTKSYKRIFPGNSSVKLNLGPFSVGLSNENLWWGPSQMNGLLMSSHAPGFIHTSFNTRYPWRTFLGSIEFQVIAGYLDSSGFQMPTKNDEVFIVQLKKQDKRYINAGIISFKPRFLNGVSVGISRSIQVYKLWLDEGGSRFLLFGNIDRKSDTDYNIELNRDQLASFFLRWNIKKANAEFYVEWGRNDAFYAKRDLLLQPNHSRAYTLGFRKIFNSNSNKKFEILTETTHQKQNLSRLIRDSDPDWYMHGQVTHGMTNRGEVLGAYIGPGSNSKFIRITNFDEKKLLSVQLEQTKQFTDIYERIFGLNDPNVRRWVDYILRFQGQYRLKNMIFNAQLALKYSYNYYWYQETDTEFRGMNYTGDLPAAMLQLGVMWRL